MEKINLLVDTDVFIDYFNSGKFSSILENRLFVIYYSIITEKELLSKGGIKTSEKEAIVYTLKNYRRVGIDKSIALKYPELMKLYPSLDKEDALIAATAIIKNLPLLTRNYRHYRRIKGLILFTGRK